MRSRLLALACCVFALVLVAGCRGGGGGGSASGGGGGVDVAGLPAGDGGGAVVAGDGGDEAGGGIPHQPEPATIALLGGGLSIRIIAKEEKIEHK